MGGFGFVCLNAGEISLIMLFFVHAMDEFDKTGDSWPFIPGDETLLEGIGYFFGNVFEACQRALGLVQPRRTAK